MNSKRTTHHKTNPKHLTILIIGFIFAVCFCSVGFSYFLSSAKESSSRKSESYTYYKSIEIKSGDSLWKIASENINDNYDSIPEYIQAIKKINNLDTDNIHSGQNLIIEYTDGEFR